MSNTDGISTFNIPGLSKWNPVPSRVCAICGKWEAPGSVFVSSETWLCCGCVDRLKRMLYPEESGPEAGG